jgi:RIO kinase 1
MNFEEDDLFLKNKEMNQLKKIHNKISNNLFREKDKSDRQTIDQVLDPRIMRIIEKFKNSQLITEFSGCISTGKEANVYYARGKGTPDNEDINREIAIKIYKTSILIFKDRERYITGEFRFRHGYCKSNPRKMVSLWCEKEIRNLKRIKQKGVKCPEPYDFKSNLIMMEFIGKDGVAAPRLKDALDSFENIEEFDNCYLQIMEIMKKMYQKCKLVHSDFSEYNLLYYNKEVYVIDLAQAVEENHPNADYFLKRDIHNMNEFFNKNHIDTLTDQQFYDFVVEKNIKDCKEYVDKCRAENKINIEKDEKFKIKQNDIFCKYEVPFNLMQLATDNMLDSKMDLEIALNNLVKRQKEKEEKEEKEKENYKMDIDEEEEEEEEEEEKEEEEKEEKKEKKKNAQPWDGMTKQEWKKKVKEDKRERRANKKFSKKEKQKLIKKSQFKNKK